ncbi:IS110 family transposase [Nocardia cyriacigeorgica]|uniref:IS110 family transposase n=1 Tax=Nocardia cyriacigeorgica TaxID=135487 RepID=A0A5R8PG46_9NOCA|nr:IS110 family transposase [Nocardia cyriacigeorgica]MBF6093970.1 IS110 family transposase [Nocardia cyriacigeorgica]TLG12472.1 IS110 family transposase [Nocardia cyriacigeorgica]
MPKATPTGQVVIAVDPHKASWTAVAVDQHCRPLGSLRVEVNRAGYRQLRRFARAWPHAIWAIEGARGLGAPLAQKLAIDGIETLDVPAKLAHRVRMLSTGHGRKIDEADALSVGIAALNSTGLQSMRTDSTAQVLRTLTEYRDDLILTRTQTANRLHRLLVQLVPAGLPKRLTAEAAAQLLRSVRPREHYGRTLRQVAVDLVTELRRLDRRIDTATDSLDAAVTESRTQLTTIHGVGTVVAAKILAHTGNIRRFRSAAAFASYGGVAPIEVSSGDARRHRLSRAGDRQLNDALHVIAITQIRRDTVGRAYYQRKRAAGKGHKEALRCLKRQLADVVYRIMLRDAGTSLLAGA